MLKPSEVMRPQCQFANLFITAELPRSSAPRAALQLHESLARRACMMEVPSPCASCKICCQEQITQRHMPDLGQNDSNAIRYEDQEVCRSNTELTDEGSQGDPIHWR
jgi:hypothetical protein